MRRILEFKGSVTSHIVNRFQNVGENLRNISDPTYLGDDISHATPEGRALLRLDVQNVVGKGW